MPRWFELAIVVTVLGTCLALPSNAGAPKQADSAAIDSADGDHPDQEWRRMSTKPIVDDPALPRVLLLGDSIAMGYSIPLRERLKGKANVHFPHENCHTSRQILEQIDTYLGEKPWDVIHFNCGIHDATIKNKQGQSVKAGEQGEVQVPIAEYRENLEKIIARLKRTRAQLIWCSSTPVDNVFPHRKPADIVRYNAIAKEVMQKHEISVTDLHSVATQSGKPKWSDGAHFTKDGSRELARSAAVTIAAVLPRRPVDKTKPSSATTQSK